MEISIKDSVWAKGVIREAEFFNACSDEEIQLLAEGFEKARYPKGATIIFGGEISNKLYLVQQGRVSVHIKKKKNLVKIAELGAVEIFGEISLLTPRTATATVKAEEDTDIIMLSGEVFQSVVGKNPALEKNMKEKIERRLKMQEDFDGSQNTSIDPSSTQDTEQKEDISAKIFTSDEDED